MRNLILLIAILFSGFVSAQTFEFECEEDLYAGAFSAGINASLTGETAHAYLKFDIPQQIIDEGLNQDYIVNFYYGSTRFAFTARIQLRDGLAWDRRGDWMSDDSYTEETAILTVDFPLETFGASLGIDSWDLSLFGMVLSLDDDVLFRYPENVDENTFVTVGDAISDEEYQPFIVSNGHSHEVRGNNLIVLRDANNNYIGHYFSSIDVHYMTITFSGDDLPEDTSAWINDFGTTEITMTEGEDISFHVTNPNGSNANYYYTLGADIANGVNGSGLVDASTLEASILREAFAGNQFYPAYPATYRPHRYTFTSNVGGKASVIVTVTE